jgi:cytidylate kinase
VSVIVAVDGPAGSGKSSVSKAVARQLGFSYLDTGAAYRVVTWSCLDSGVDLENESAVVEHLAGMGYQAPVDPDNQVIELKGSDITEAIRSEHTSTHVSAIAKHPQVRALLNDGFRALASSAQNGIIIEGRDITTIVAPDAPVRVLLTADEPTRIARRQAEMGNGNAAALSQRDQADRQVVDFMTAADGVHTIDSTHLTFDQTVQALRSLIEPHLEKAGA